MTAEHYSVECWSCRRTVQLPAKDGPASCPNCGAVLDVQWSAARAEANRKQEAGETA